MADVYLTRVLKLGRVSVASEAGEWLCRRGHNA